MELIYFILEGEMTVRTKDGPSYLKIRFHPHFNEEMERDPQ